MYVILQKRNMSTFKSFAILSSTVRGLASFLNIQNFCFFPIQCNTSLFALSQEKQTQRDTSTNYEIYDGKQVQNRLIAHDFTHFAKNAWTAKV